VIVDVGRASRGPIELRTELQHGCQRGLADAVLPLSMTEEQGFLVERLRYGGLSSRIMGTLVFLR